MIAQLPGQLDLLDLLVSLEPKPEPAAASLPKLHTLITCVACGRISYDDHNPSNQALHWMDINPPPICGLMHTRRCHVVSAMRQLTGAHGPDPCCSGWNSLHGRAISSPTKQHRLDHIKHYLELARTDWHLHLDYLNDWVARSAVVEGVKFGDVFQEWGVAE